MDGLTVNHMFFDLLRKDHDAIRTKLEALLVHPDSSDLLNWLWTQVELSHHKKEEKILFNSLIENPNVNGGGPLCMLYLDNYILNSPLDRARRLTGNIPALEEHTRKIFDEASAMRIPVNEHRAGKELLRFLIEAHLELRPEETFKLAKEYRDIQIEHMNKEENCFFYHCVNLLNPTAADDLLMRWKSAESGNSN